MIEWLPPTQGMVLGGPMDDFIARENIRRFEAQLQSSADEMQKREIRRLLNAERRHLQQIEQSQSPGPR